MTDFSKTSSRPLAMLLFAAALGGGLSATPALAKSSEPVAEPQLRLNGKFRAAIATAQAAIAANDAAGAQGAITSAASVVQTADEQFVLAKLELSYAQQTGDRAKAAAALDKLIASGVAANRLTERDKALYYGNQGEFAFQAKDYVKAERAFVAALAAGNAEPQTAIFLADSQAHNGRPADAIKSILRAADASAAAGQKAPRAWYERGVDIASRAKLPDEFITITTAWLAAYPERENWYVTLTIYRQIAALTGDANLDFMRLLRATASTPLYGEKDYLDHAQAVYVKFPNEAVSLLREGITANKLRVADDPAIGRIMKQAEPKIAPQKASLAAKAKALAGGTASYAAATDMGDLFSSFNDFAKAAEAYQLALSKAGTNADQANFHFGLALARSGNAAGATAAFDAVRQAPYAGLASYGKAWVAHPAH